jgi:H+/Cl- antiporter ClcA
LNVGFLEVAAAHPFWPLFITPIGFMLIVYVMRTFFPGTEGSGIPQVIAALQLNSLSTRKRLVSLKIAFGKFFLTMLGFMSGGSLGREGPTIQLAASLMHSLGRWGTFNRHDTEKGLLLAGGAAGIAAAFNAPLAGIVFAIEELSGSFEKGVSGTIITTVVLCGIVAQSIMGNYSYFGSSNATLNIIHGGSLPIIVVSVVAGALGGFFSLMLLKVSSLMKAVVKKNPLWVAGLLGLSVALIGLVSNGMTYGSGYGAAKDIITNNIGLNQDLDIYGPLKMLATLLTYLSGIPGGIFAPSLSAGAGIGQIISYWFDPRLHDAVVLLCTVGYFSGVVQSPITAFVIVLEMTDSATSNMVLPIMLCSLMATAVSKVICREPLYSALSQRYLSLLKTEKPAVNAESEDDD